MALGLFEIDNPQTDHRAYGKNIGRDVLYWILLDTKTKDTLSAFPSSAIACRLKPANFFSPTFPQISTEFSSTRASRHRRIQSTHPTCWALLNAVAGVTSERMTPAVIAVTYRSPSEHHTGFERKSGAPHDEMSELWLAGNSSFPPAWFARVVPETCWDRPVAVCVLPVSMACT
jgi:hypothetical protein